VSCTAAAVLFLDMSHNCHQLSVRDADCVIAFDCASILRSYVVSAILYTTELFPFYIQCYRTSPLPTGTHTLVLVQKSEKLVSCNCCLCANRSLIC
jgi:hypothetical protein